MIQEKEQEEIQGEYEPKEENQKTRTRVRSVNFLRVEDATSDQPLTKFELDVKEKIICLATPLQELLNKEKQISEIVLKRNKKIKLFHLVKKAKLTERQRECFELAYRKKLSDRQIAEIMGISRNRVVEIRAQIKRALVRAFIRQLNNVYIQKFFYSGKITRKQRDLWKLRYVYELSIREIAERLGKTVCAIEKALQRITRKISNLKMSGNLRHPPFNRPILWGRDKF